MRKVIEELAKHREYVSSVYRRTGDPQALWEMKELDRRIREMHEIDFRRRHAAMTAQVFSDFDAFRYSTSTPEYDRLMFLRGIYEKVL